MNWIQSLFIKIEKYFASPAGRQTIETLNNLVELAMPIVQDIALVTGKAGAAASVAAVESAYAKYGVPLEQTLVAGNSTQIGNALQNLAVTVLQKNLPANTSAVATNLLNTAVSLAVTALKAA